MSDQVKLAVEKREKLGTAESRRLRSAGIVPGNVYGLDKEPVAVSIKEDEIRALIQAGEQIVEVDVVGDTDTTLISAVQWDTFSSYIQHVDLLRVDPTKTVNVDVSLELRGISPGVVAGGNLDQQTHSITIDCPVIAVPGSITIRINDLNVGESITAGSLELPTGASLVGSPDAVIVRVTEATDVDLDEESAGDGPAEPELIGRSAADEEE